MRVNRKVFALLCVLALVCSGLFACDTAVAEPTISVTGESATTAASRSTTTPTGPSTTTSAGLSTTSGVEVSSADLSPASSSSVSVGEKVVRVTDQNGRTVEISGDVRRIVSGYYISTSACIALGLSDRLAGIEARAASRPIYALAASELLELPDVGTAREFNLEACAALEPDLAILPLRLSDAADTLSELGIPAILVNPESYDGLCEMISLIGTATGTTDASARLLEYYARRAGELEKLTASVAESDKPRVYMCGVSSYLSTVANGMYQYSMIEMAGGRNSADIDGGGRTEVSYEELITLNPDVIIIPPEAEYGVDDIAGDIQLKSLDAVTGGRIYKMPGNYEAWDSPVPSCMLGVEWLLSILHGELLSDGTLQKDISQFYNEFYGTKFT